RSSVPCSVGLNLECGDSSPLSVTATDCGEPARADQSARAKGAASCRTPKNAVAAVCDRTRWNQKPSAVMDCRYRNAAPNSVRNFAHPHCEKSLSSWCNRQWLVASDLQLATFG